MISSIKTTPNISRYGCLTLEKFISNHDKVQSNEAPRRDFSILWFFHCVGSGRNLLYPLRLDNRKEKDWDDLMSV